MKRGRNTTQEERIQISKDCLTSGKNYGEMALKYQVSYQQARTWTLRYEELGEAGLEDRRGKRRKDQEPRTELKKAQIEIEQLKHKLYLAENLLNRQFFASKTNEKWLTNVTEFKWYEGIEIHKIYLSAILDLYDRRIVTYVIEDRNDNLLVFQTFDKAVKEKPGAHPLFHSDRGFQYTNRTFHTKLTSAGMAPSMFRVAHCIDNGQMEGFWGILKRERYYGKRFTSKDELVQMIIRYIQYCNTCRVQRNLGILTPMEKHEQYLAA